MKNFESLTTTRGRTGYIMRKGRRKQARKWPNVSFDCPPDIKEKLQAFAERERDEDEPRPGPKTKLSLYMRKLVEAHVEGRKFEPKGPDPEIIELGSSLKEDTSKVGRALALLVAAALRDVEGVDLAAAAQRFVDDHFPPKRRRGA